MGLFDYFYPEPAIGCARPECTGKLIGWQGKYNGNCLFQWRQGCVSPFDQNASEDCKLDAVRLSAFRLPRNEIIRASCPKCDRCNAAAPFSIECITDEYGCWTATKVIGQTSAGRILEHGWVQCANCLDAIPEITGKEVYACPSCKSTIFLRMELVPVSSK